MLGEDTIDHGCCFDAGKGKVEALVLEVELFVVDAETIQDCSIEIANMNGVLSYIVTEIVGFAVDRTAFDAGAGHPHRVAARVMVTSVVGFGERALAIDGAAELPSPNDEGVVEHTSLFEIGYERVRRLVDVFTLVGKIFGQSAVLVPSSVEDLRKTNAFFR